MIIGYLRAFIHGVQAVKKTDDLLLIEKRNRGKDRAAKCVVDQRTQFFLRVQSGGWTEEWVLLSLVNRISDYVADGLAENLFVGHAVDFLVYRLGTKNLHDLMIEKRHATFNRVRHLHAIAEHIKDVTGQQRL